MSLLRALIFFFILIPAFFVIGLLMLFPPTRKLALLVIGRFVSQKLGVHTAVYNVRYQAGHDSEVIRDVTPSRVKTVSSSDSSPMANL